MTGDFIHSNDNYTIEETFCPSKPWSHGHGEMESVGISKGRGPPVGWAPNFEVIDGLLYRKKLERGFINYREVLDEGRRQEAIFTFHRRMRPGQRHLSLEETYKCVAENYWWEEMFFQIRDFVLGCPDCRRQITRKTKELDGRGCVTKTMVSHGDDVLSKLKSQREAGMFCDITLRTNGRPYLAHRSVLAAVSDHFQEVFTEIGSNMKADIDLTGFSEGSLLSLLDFSYSSTLCVRQEDLSEVMAMARHLGMWLAVEACSALIKEQEQQCHPSTGFTSACPDACHEHHCQRRESKRKKVLELEDNNDTNCRLLRDASDGSLEGSPRCNLRRTTINQGHNSLPLSPSHRMKLMDFKSPSSKNFSSPQPISPSNTRVLRSAPEAAKVVRRVLPMSETPRRNKKPPSMTQLPCSSVRVKQEVEVREAAEEEQDYARAQEKYELMNVLGLQRTALIPRPEDLIGWRQKKRLRKLKVNNYSLTKRRTPRSDSPGLPFGAVTLSLPLCNPVNTRLLNKIVKVKSVSRVSTEALTKRKTMVVQKRVPPNDRSMRSKGALPDIFSPSFMVRELRQSVRKGDGAHRAAKLPVRRRITNKTLVTNTVRIKSEPVEYSISGLAFPSNNGCGHTPQKSQPQRIQTRNKVTVETVQSLRYNSSRLAVKDQLRKSKCMPGEERTKVENQGLRGIMDTRQKLKGNENGFSQQEPPASIYNNPLYKVIKKEPSEPVPVGGPFSDPSSPDRGKRQSKPPIKLLDSGFLFSFCRPAGGAMAVLKKEEETVDICLTRSVSEVGEKFGEETTPQRSLRARGTPTLPVMKREERRCMNRSKAQSTRPKTRNNTLHLAKAPRSKASGTTPKQGKVPLSSRNCIMLDAVHRARLKQLRGPCSQAPKVPKASHACLQCPALYKDCDALMMHRIRHVEGKHWPCPLCSKNFFRLRNVRGHIRNHDPKLYKCRSCIVAGT